MNTQKDNKRIAKNTLFLYFRQFFVMSITLYTSRLVLKELGVEDYGIYNVIGGVVAMLSILSSSLSSAMSRFFTYELGLSNIPRLKLIFSTCICVLIALSSCVLLIGELFGNWVVNDFLVMPKDRLSQANIVLQASLIAFVFNLLSTPFFGAIIAYERMNAFAYFSIVEAFGKLSVAIGLQLTIYDKLVTFSILQTTLSFIMLLSYIIFCIMKLEGCTLSLKFSKTHFFSMSKYATWSMFGVMAYVGQTHGYNIILNIFFGPVVNAARGVAFQVQSAIVSFANNFQASLNPQIIKNYASENIERMHELVIASSKYSFYLMLLLVMPVVLEADFILKMWLVEVPRYTVSFVRLVLVAMCFEVLSGPMICSQNATGNIKYMQIISGIIMLSSLPVCYYLFILDVSPVMLYYVFLLFTIITLFFRVCYTCPNIGISLIKYVKEVLFKISMVSIFSIPLPLFLNYHMTSGFFQLIIVSIVSSISILISIFLYGLTSKEKKFLQTKLNETLPSLKNISKNI